MAEQRKTIRKTKAYNGTLYRNDVQAGVFIFGWGDDTRFFAEIDSLPYLKAGWWVPVSDTVVVAEPEEPEPDPTAPATLYTPAERFEIPMYDEDGTFVGTYRNANEIRWTLV